jgi:NAD(P)-dependent dehydrogenase (short-subunit alcohol dehydrogenase family)
MHEGDAVYPSLKDRAVLITGGATGIGAAHVGHFAVQGARVAFIDIQEEPARALCDAIAAKGRPKPLFLKCDLRDIAALQAAIAEAAGRLGPFGVLVNNAAHDERHDWKTVTPEYWEDRLAVNLRHQFFAIQAVAPMMQAAKAGSIVNFGSISWHLAMGGMPAYTTAKAGIEGLTRSFAKDLGPDNIRVNCVIPGWILTERQKALWLTPEAERRTLEAQCLKRMLVPDDVARLVLWLAADDSRMCTSQLFTVDGGWW